MNGSERRGGEGRVNACEVHAIRGMRDTLNMPSWCVCETECVCTTSMRR